MAKAILSKIDYSVLKATVTAEKILEAAEETKRYGFATLCVFPKHIPIAREILPSERICTVIGFPLATVPTDLKLKEIEFSIEKGAFEFDVVVDISAVKEGDWLKVEKELEAIRELAKGYTLKLIFECCYLTEGEKRALCQLAAETEWDYVKTSTGYGSYGATKEDVELLVSCCGSKVKVKAAGGIRDLETAKELIELGAERIGTSSAVKIAEEVLHSREV